MVSSFCIPEGCLVGWKECVKARKRTVLLSRDTSLMIQHSSSQCLCNKLSTSLLLSLIVTTSFFYWQLGGKTYTPQHLRSYFKDQHLPYRNSMIERLCRYHTFRPCERPTNMWYQYALVETAEPRQRLVHPREPSFVRGLRKEPPWWWRSLQTRPHLVSIERHQNMITKTMTLGLKLLEEMFSHVK